MNNPTPYPSFAPENFWAELRELIHQTAQMQKENEKTRAENEKIRAENERYLKELQAETSLQMKETDRRMKELQKTLGGWANNHGTFAEEYFYNSFERGKQNFFGEKFDVIQKNLTNFWQGLKDEYDIVLYNHVSIALIEVKYKAHVNDIPEVLKKADTFRILFPNYKNFKIYLGLASMAFYPELERKCIHQGIAIIKQVGDNVVIYDEHLKVF